MINWWFGVRWFGFLGSPCERDYSLGVPGKNPKPLGPKPPIYHSLTCMSPKNIYTSMSMKKKNECLNIYIHTVSNTNMGRIILPYSINTIFVLGSTNKEYHLPLTNHSWENRSHKPIFNGTQVTMFPGSK